jgi:hypothetical protein
MNRLAAGLVKQPASPPWRLLMSAIDLTTTDVLTIEEAAAILRISRNAAYAAARLWRATNGESGLPCIEIGRTLRVPRTSLDKLLGRYSATESA